MTPVRAGVDVGGTFTKAVLVAASGTIVGSAVVPSTHDAPRGVAEGVVRALQRVAQLAPAPVGLVVHSTTQAVNALLEGDVASVGIVGLGGGRDARKAERRTRLAPLELAPGRTLSPRHVFLDTSSPLTLARVDAALDALTRAGAQAIAVAGAFATEDPRDEDAVRERAAARGLEVCAGHDLTGVYGLEVRAATAALNASILPIAARTASYVAEALSAAGLGAPPLLVLRGDGGAADMDAFRTVPLRTLYSGPAASVVGALHHLAVGDAVVVEVGGTSTNVSAVSGGRPGLTYVRVRSHVTAVRALDVRVAGVAGGSLPRLVGRRLAGVGPRSAHIAGVAYASFSDPAVLEGAQMRLVAPRPGDPPTYAVLECRDGSRVGITVTCAANALGETEPGTYACGDKKAALAACTVLGAPLGRSGGEVAKAIIDAAVDALLPYVRAAIADAGLPADVPLVGLGGGAGALVRALAKRLHTDAAYPAHAEVISSIGDALSLLRAEVERTMAAGAASRADAVAADAVDELVRQGAAPQSIEVRTETVPERGVVRAIATGAFPLPGVLHRDPEAAAAAVLGETPLSVGSTGHYTAWRAGQRVAVIDAHAEVALLTDGDVFAGASAELHDAARDAILAASRRFGVFDVLPEVQVLRGARLLDLSGTPGGPDALVAAVLTALAGPGDPNAIVVVSRKVRK